MFWIMFQLFLTRVPMGGLVGLNWVTITGNSLSERGTVSSNSS